jgi:hypothetical protein
MKIIYLILGLFLVGSLFGCVPAEKKCSVDADCVQASCCHASDAVSKEFAPDCKGILCSMECVPGTIDCGQGEVQCVKGSCEAVLKE